MSARHVSRPAFTAIFCAALLAGMLMVVPAQGQIPTTPTTIYTFPGNGGAANPIVTTAQGRDGNLYFGTCIPTTSNSALFNVTTSGTLSTVYVPINCLFGVTLGTDGNFYTVVNDASCCGNTNGEVLKVTPTGTATVLHTFTGGTDGSQPIGTLVQGTNGLLTPESLTRTWLAPRLPFR